MCDQYDAPTFIKKSKRDLINWAYVQGQRDLIEEQARQVKQVKWTISVAIKALKDKIGWEEDCFSVESAKMNYLRTCKDFKEYITINKKHQYGRA